jgi:hypothetical protein
MGNVFYDRVKETSATVGASDFTLLGAATGGFTTFSATVGIGNNCYYTIVNPTANEWEVGIGTLSDATTLTRDSITASSNSGLAVSFSAGTKDVFLSFIAQTANDSISGLINSGRIGSGQISHSHLANAAVTSGNIASGQVGKSHIASGAVTSGQLGTTGTPDGTKFLRDDFTWTTAFTLTSGIITSGLIGDNAVNSGNISSGAIGFEHLADGSVQSGTIGSGQVNHFHIGNAEIQSGNIASGVISRFHNASGAVNSGHVASGAVKGQAGGGAFNIASGTIGTFDIGSGAVQSGRVASGQIGFGHLADNSVQSGTIASGIVSHFHIGNAEIQSGNLASGVISRFHNASGAVNSGHVASGAIIGQAGAGAFNIASGTIGTFDIGSGAIVSGRIASGVVGNLHISSGAVTSGRLGVTGTPDGTQFLKDDFSWGAPSATITSGQIVSGLVGDNAVNSGNISSGAIGHSHVGNAAIQSGNIASGVIGGYNIASGYTPIFTAMFFSGTAATEITEETISGVRAVALSQSGNIRVAMASVSGRMPAIGIVIDNVASGIQANVYTAGNFQFTSGMADYSGYLGLSLFVGRSGQIVTTSGSFNSGGFASGDVIQSMGIVNNSGQITSEIGAALQEGFIQSGNISSGQIGQFHLSSGAVNSGHIASGNLITYAQNIIFNTFTTGQDISGFKAVAFNSGGSNIVQAERSSGLRMPAFGISIDNVLSGSTCRVVRMGRIIPGVSGIISSGFVNTMIYVGSGGNLVSFSGWNGTGVGPGAAGASGMLIQRIGLNTSGGIEVMVDSHVVGWGFLVSGTVGPLLASGGGIGI